MTKLQFGFKVLQPGTVSTIQDIGRFGWQHLGICPGGPMDHRAFSIANQLLHNDVDTAVLELAGFGFRAQATSDLNIALAGADIGFHLNDQPVQPWQTIQVKHGDILTTKGGRQGQWAYIAVQGGWQTPQVLNSRSTSPRIQLGGFHPSAQSIQANDFLSCRPQTQYTAQCLLQRFQPQYQFAPVLRFIPGDQFNLFNRLWIQQFFQTQFRVTAWSDRMAVRLSAEGLSHQVSGGYSEGNCYGAVQIPENGSPIILLRDRQTVGGYPKIGSLLPMDADRLAQCHPNTKVRFTQISLQDAQSIFSQYAKAEFPLQKKEP